MCLRLLAIPLTLFSWGAGSPVLLVHGCGAGAGATHRLRAAPDLGYRVLACDLPAHGQTAGEQKYCFRVYNFTIQTIAAEGEFAGIINHSWEPGYMALSDGVSEKSFVWVACWWLSSAVKTIKTAEATKQKPNSTVY